MARMAWQSSPKFFFLAVVVTTVASLVPVVMAWVTKLLFDQIALIVAGGQIDSDYVIPLLVFNGILLFLSKMFPLVSHFIDSELGRHLEIDIQTSLYSKINDFAGIRYFESPKFHDLMRLSEQGAQMGPTLIVVTITALIGGTVTLLSFTVVVAAINMWLLVLLFVSGVPSLVIALRIGEQRVQLARQTSTEERKSMYYSSLLGDTDSANEMRLFGLGAYFIQKLVRSLRINHDAKRSQEIRELRLNSILEALASTVQLSAISIVIWQALRKLITIGDVTFFTSAIQNIQGALQTLVTGFSMLNESALFFQHYEKLLMLPQPIWISPRTTPVPTLQHGIQLRNVWFRYDDDLPWILKGVDLSIPAGSCLALVGLNGEGKSTIVKLLSRLYDVSHGEILWDGINIMLFDPSEYRERLGAVMQDFTRYELTAGENIGLGNLPHMQNPDLIRKAAAMGNVDGFIERLPERYDTVLSRWLLEDDSETGSDLSGGQWQRIAIARMFMRQADFIILDEPTSALDAEAEYEMYEQSKHMVAGRTSLLISHRFSTVRMANLIAVLANGRIVEYGSHQQLMDIPSSIYAGLFRKQAGRYGAAR